MKNCPVCSEDFVQIEYEGEAVLRCPKCRGSVRPGYRLEIIRHRQLRKTDELKAEAQSEFSHDTKDKIRCPRCHGKMEKRPIDGRYPSLTLDHCRNCDWIWLDGGELPLAQLLFETSARNAVQRDMQKRAAELEASPERKAEFEKNLAALPDDLPGASGDARQTLVADALDLAFGIILRS